MIIERVWAMPCRWTFTIKPIKALLQEVMVGTQWADPFAGRNSPAKYRNDLSFDAVAESNKDALEWLRSLPTNSLDGVLYDPPYSFRQASECYKMRGLPAKLVTSKKYWMQCKNEIGRILKPGGIAICFGWNSNGVGKTRGFQLDRLLVVAHGGSMNDTLITVEHKL